MLRNKLSILLAERGIKATKVSNDTGIARSTLSKINNNSSEKIDYSTINTLCRYLKITPCDFFEYLPFDIDFFVSIDEHSIYSPEEGLPTYKIEAFLNIVDNAGKHSIEYEGFIESYGLGPNNTDALGAYIEPASDDDVFDIDLYLSDISQTFITDITQKFNKKIIKAVRESGFKPSDNDFITINLFDKKNK
ncbi:helix-turn-helix transcriptional regulator [Enterococcus faecalis]|uniref:helix-turn-helix domain-containing protein n=1 Tax=Enterococcus faecalis TaxID=1351 RepID=UPI002DB62B20|nr:helix-turn-helix transcriptional regulator [Enterococcus faecalis]MEB5927222.1 helix-turn-helix transcriptional regulator [Enterococcus faecalis]